MDVSSVIPSNPYHSMSLGADKCKLEPGVAVCQAEGLTDPGSECEPGSSWSPALPEKLMMSCIRLTSAGASWKGKDVTEDSHGLH